GEHAADLDAEPQNIGTELFGAFELARLVGVVEDQRMQVAVAGMKHIGDAQAVFRRHVLHAAEHKRQLGARDGAVHAVIVRRDATDGREGGFAAGPEQQPLLFGIGDAIRYRSTLPGDVLDAFEQMIDLGARAVEFDDQQRLDVERIAGMDEFLGGMNGGAVHHLHAARNDAGADDPSDAVAGILRGGETDQRGARGFRFFQDAHRHFGDDAEHAFRAGDDTQQIVAAGIEMPAAEPHDLAGYQHQFAAEHVVGGDAVFEA